MRQPLSFFVAGIPNGQPRVKASRFGGHARVYTPITVKDSSGISREHPAHAWKLIVRQEAKQAWQSQDARPFEGPLRVDLTFYFPRPKGHFRANGQMKPNAPKWHTSKPDRDNCDKLVLDALTQLGVWADDKQVCAGQICKLYADLGTMSGVKIEISEAAP